MKVLVTRPDPEGSELCRQIEQHQVRASHFPLISFSKGEGASQLSSLLTDADIVIAVSKHAVLWSDKILQSQQLLWPDKADYFAIGQKTAQNLRRVSLQNVHYPAISDSEHFLQLPQLQNIAGKKVVILRGNGGRELIYDTLKKFADTVAYCEVYQRHKREYDRASQLADWQQQGITHLIITSGEQLEHLAGGISDDRWLTSKMIIVPSQRIADLANELGFNNVLVSGSASNPDLLAAILPRHITGQAHDK